MRAVPCGELFDAGDSADGLREFGMPSDDVAANQQSDTLDGGNGFCGGQLLYLPQPDAMDERSVQSRRDRLAFGGLAPNGAGGQSRSLHGLPRRQQLHVHGRKHGLLWVPPDSLEQHLVVWRECAEPHHRRISYFTLFVLPRHGFMDGFDVQPRQNRFPADEFASACPGRQGYGMQPVPWSEL